MSRSVFIILISFVVLSGCSEKPKNLPDLINEKFTGDLAYETTEYVEKYWRIAGNSGFDSSSYRVTQNLEKLGYVLEKEAGESDRLTDRIETRPLKRPTWEPIDATVLIAGEESPLFQIL